MSGAVFVGWIGPLHGELTHQGRVFKLEQLYMPRVPNREKKEAPPCVIVAEVWEDGVHVMNGTFNPTNFLAEKGDNFVVVRKK